MGEKTKTGDAITCQFTDPATGRDVVVVIDGGRTGDGERIAAHVRRYYGTNRVDLMICTHPDDDHIKGLFEAIEELDVAALLIHRPAAYGYRGDDVKSPLVEELIGVARENGTAVHHEFTGASFFGGALTILGPSKSYYQELLGAQRQSVVAASALGRALSKAANVVARAIRGISSDPGETLTDDNGGTTPRNNSSVIVNLSVDNYRALFTGDAGVPALQRAADLLDYLRITGGPDLFDMPHHGSRHNLDPETLDRLLGPINGGARRGSAFVSVGKEADDFPRPEVANALRRRGYPVIATRGETLRWNRGGATRPEYTAAVPIGWLEE